MAWARIDDGFYDHPKTVKAWGECPGSIGLHIRAIAWCAKQEQDGHIPAEVVAVLSPLQRDREDQVTALLDAGMWHENEGDYVLHDYLDYNPSRDETAEKRRVDRERKREARRG